MPVQVTKCASCGRDFEVEVPDFLGSVSAIVAVCTDCAYKEHIAEGGQVAQVVVDEDWGPLFRTSLLVTSPGAVRALAEAGQEAKQFLVRHLAGQWGKLGDFDSTEVTAEERANGTDEDAKVNRIAVEKGSGRVLSVFQTAKDEEIWVTTDLKHAETTVMLPSEY